MTPQYQVKLPLSAYVLSITDKKKHFGFYPLTDNVPMLFSSKKAALRHKLRHERIIRVRITAQ